VRISRVATGGCRGPCSKGCRTSCACHSAPIRPPPG
jgi:hypothetical protein